MQNYNNNPHNAIEVPLPKRRISYVGIFIFILILIGLVFAAMESVKNPEFYEKYGNAVKLSFVFLLLYGPVAGIISPFVETSRLKRVCTVRTGGTLVGYASQYVNNYDDETHTGESYYKYAPKYEIYINGHFEIRTLNDFTRSRSSPGTIALLANPDGYEIIPINGKMSYSNRQSVKAGIALLVIYGIIIAGLAIFFSGFNPFL